MTERVPAGTRVQLSYTLLEAEQRAPGLPHDTADVPYVVRVKGILHEPAALGDTAAVRTTAGRLLEGRLSEVAPADSHTFGRPVAALVTVVDAITRMLEADDERA